MPNMGWKRGTLSTPYIAWKRGALWVPNMDSERRSESKNGSRSAPPLWVLKSWVESRVDAATDHSSIFCDKVRSRGILCTDVRKLKPGWQLFSTPSYSQYCPYFLDLRILIIWSMYVLSKSVIKNWTHDTENKTRSFSIASCNPTETGGTEILKQLKNIYQYILHLF